MIGKERSFVSERGKDLAAFGRECWNAASEFRADRLRNKRYTFGDQWRDPVTVDGHVMSEEEYIRREGNIPLKNNLIRRLVRNVVGVFRKEFSEQLSEWDAEERDHARRQRLEELYGRTMEEFLISGLAVHKLRRGMRGGEEDVWVDSVSPDSFFYDPDARDPRGADMRFLGQLHELSPRELASHFGGGRDAYRRLMTDYGMRRHVVVVELWERQKRPRMLCHDKRRGMVLKVDEGEWHRSADFRGMPSRWILDDVWRFHFVTEDGEILSEGDSPLADGGHPFVMKAYPFLDGEIHSFVSDIIDQQRYTNRLITMYDWMMRASAKGVLLFPEDALPIDGDIQEVADQWGRFNGVIVYRPQIGQPLPQQVNGAVAPGGISDLLNIQLKMMEDVSGVSGALQGRMDSKSMSGELFGRQTENSLTSLRDILESYRGFIETSRTRMRAMRSVTCVSSH